MLTSNRKQTLYLFRELALKLMDIHGENTEAYIYLSGTHLEIVYLSLLKVNFLNNVKVAKMPLVRVFIYTLIEEYPQIQTAQLVLIAFRIIRRYSTKQLSSLVGCSIQQYEKLESGFYLFQDQFSFEKLSKALNIPKEFFISSSCFSPYKFLEQ